MADRAKTIVVEFILMCLIFETHGFLTNTNSETGSHSGSHTSNQRYSWNTWGAWSACHVHCNLLATHTYNQSRTRTCHDIHYYHQVPNDHCGSSASHTDTRTCPNHCGSHHLYSWTTWGAWSSCHVNCSLLATHTYNHSRTRTCYNNHYHHQVPTDHCGSRASHQETRACPNHCPHWSAWSDWTGCSATCGGGTTIRVRHCGTMQDICLGDPFEINTCGTGTCAPAAVNGGWGAWKDWSACSHSCDSGVKTRQRSCDNPAPKLGGNTCDGTFSTTTTCHLPDCPIDGAWGMWGQWTSCSQSCGLDVRTRQRSCDRPAPQHGGSTCSGASADIAACQLADCPIDGGWGDWTTWTPCDVTCGSGQDIRVRLCNNPAPAHGGKLCNGTSLDTRTCNVSACHHWVEDGGWSDWSNWSSCDVVCGYGHKWRSRTCTNPVPTHGGVGCTGNAHDQQLCHNGTCPDDLKTCYDSGIHELIYANPYVVDSTPSPHVTCDTPISTQEQLLSTICHVTSSALDWTLGTPMSDSCEKTPLFSPVALIPKQNLDRKYGILLDCYLDVIQIVDLSCKLQVHVYRLNDTQHDYHIVIM